MVIAAEDWETTAEEIDDLFIGDAGSRRPHLTVSVWLRSHLVSISLTALYCRSTPGLHVKHVVCLHRAASFVALSLGLRHTMVMKAPGLDVEVWRRSLDETASPRGGSNPYVSPDGHNILDIRFCKPSKADFPGLSGYKTTSPASFDKGAFAL